jgi:hypothetical protein
MNKEVLLEHTKTTKLKFTLTHYLQFKDHDCSNFNRITSTVNRVNYCEKFSSTNPVLRTANDRTKAANIKVIDALMN